MSIIDINKIPIDILNVCETLCKNHFDAYLVGGCIRDSLLGLEPNDWDVATNALPEQVMNLFDSAIPTGLKHGTVTVRPAVNMDDSKSYCEVTTYRSDGKYSDGRRPDSVKFEVDISKDLARRDFTINAIAYDPIRDCLIDHYAGQRDLNAKVISCVGAPEHRFREDGLRCIRAIRFAAKLGFTIDHVTFNAIRPNIDSFKKVAYERVTSELIKIFSNPGHVVAIAITRLMASGIFDELMPEMQPMIGCEQNDWHAYDVMNHTLAVVANTNSSDPVVNLAAWFHDIGKPQTRKKHRTENRWQFLGHEQVSSDMTFKLMTRLKFPNEMRDKVCHLIKNHLVYYESNWSNASVRRLVRKIGQENVEPLLQLYRADILGKGPAKIKQDPAICIELLDRVNKLNQITPIAASVSNLAISGSDVMDLLNIGPGKLIGVILKSCLELVTENPEMNNKQLLLNWIRNSQTSTMS